MIVSGNLMTCSNVATGRQTLAIFILVVQCFPRCELSRQSHTKGVDLICVDVIVQGVTLLNEVALRVYIFLNWLQFLLVKRFT